jgi:hypothetical protein
MKRTMAIALVLAFLGGPALRAENRAAGMLIDGALIGGGGLVAALPFMVDVGESGALLCYTAGGLLAVSGITFLIFDIIFREPHTASLMADNAVLKHVSFNVLPDDKIYVGIRFKLPMNKEQCTVPPIPY